MMKNSWFLFLLLLLMAPELKAGSVVELIGPAIDMPEQVAVVNDNFRRLDAGKLDIRPKNVYPKDDNLYSLGSLEYAWYSVFATTVVWGAGTAITDFSRLTSAGSGLNSRWLSPSYIVLDPNGTSLTKVQIGGSLEGGTTFYINNSGLVHISPEANTADVQLEVSNGVTTGGGTVHAASFAAHSSRDLKAFIVYLSTDSIRTYYDELKTLRPVTFKYKRWVKTLPGHYEDDIDQPQMNGLIYEDVPSSLKGPHNDISLNNQIFMLQAALQVAIMKIELLEKNKKDKD